MEHHLVSKYNNLKYRDKRKKKKIITERNALVYDMINMGIKVYFFLQEHESEVKLLWGYESIWENSDKT